VCKAENAQEHPKFLASLKEWIKAINDSRGHLKLKDKKALQETHTTLDVEQRTGGMFEKPKKVFVLLEDWDTTDYGPADPTKVVEELLFGKLRKGIWRLVGKKGHYTFKEYDDRGVKVSTREHSGEGPFATQALEAKTQAFQASHDEAAKLRDNATVEGAKPLSMNALLELLKSTGTSGLGDAASPHVGSEPNQDSAEEDAVSSGASSDGGEDIGGGSLARIQGHFRPSKSSGASSSKGGTSSVAKAAPTKANPAPKHASKSIGKASSSTPQKSPAKPSAPSSSQSHREVAVLDGRAARLKQSLNDAFNECEIELGKIKFDEEQPEAYMNTKAKDVFQKLLQDKGRALAKLEGTARGHITRISKSPNSAAFSAEDNALNGLVNKVRTCSEFVALMKTTSPPADEWQKAVENLYRFGFSLSVPYLLQNLAVSTQQALMFQDYASLCKPYRIGSEEVRSP
jgi:hypothetical protein